MKKNIVISINPQFVEKIINGTKKYEYRTKAAKSDVHKLIIYETTPIKKIVAEAVIEEVLDLSVNEMWKKTKKYSGISKDFYNEYFRGRKRAYAYKIGKIKVYNKPKELEEYGLTFAPQSFVYVYWFWKLYTIKLYRILEETTHIVSKH